MMLNEEQQMNHKCAMGPKVDLLELARHLRQEHLFVSSERQHIQSLNDKVLKTVEKLYHISWIAKNQRMNLNSLIMSRLDSPPSVCCQRANHLENINFIDSYKQLGIHDSIYAEFLQQFREDPKLIAMCLAVGETINLESMQVTVPVIMSAIYGNCVMPEDEVYVLKLLRELMVLQLATSDNPRRLLRHGSCAFGQVYKMFSEGLFSAKRFLTATLHEAVMNVLMEDDLFLDIDPGKAVVRFHPQERIRHFGIEGTAEYLANLQKYRNRTIGKLVTLTNRFIDGIRSNMYCFPQSLSWLIRQMYGSVVKGKHLEEREVGAMCADLLFPYFICPAIVNPEPYGITDALISDIARFNLMQVAQILQVLAMSKWEPIDPKLMDLYGMFQKDCMSSVLDMILEGSPEEAPSEMVSPLSELTRFAVLITESELIGLVSFLTSIQRDCTDDALQKPLSALLANLPSNAVPCSDTFRSESANSASDTTPSATTPVGTPPLTPGIKRATNILGKVGKRTTKGSPSDRLAQADRDDVLITPPPPAGDGSNETPIHIIQLPEDVLVVPLNSADFECPGMLSEEKVLSMEQQQKQSKVRLNLENLVHEEAESITSGPEMVEKRTRFSLSQDQESIGTSDNLEAISEAASNHSVGSSLDLENENENDNLSDMVSANVSGRGTPNVSGRDTPSSQLEGEEQQRPLDFPIITRKQNRADIEDKFGKFEIQPMIEGDETKSMVSDTWSTDVLASDSETVEQSDVSLQIVVDSQPPGLLDISETASQSDAWSTDVMTSDTERLQELDTDDTASVARSDDTTRSEVEADGAGCLRGDLTALDTSDFLLEEANLLNVAGSPGLAERLQCPIPSLPPGIHRRGSQGGNPDLSISSAFRDMRQNSQQELLLSLRGEARKTSLLMSSSKPSSEQDAKHSSPAAMVPSSAERTSPGTESAVSQAGSVAVGNSSRKIKASSQNIPGSGQYYFHPLSVDVDQHNPGQNSSPSVTDDLTPTGSSPFATAAVAEPLADHAKIGSSSQETFLSMQSLGRLSMAVRELSDSVNKDCSFLLDTLQDSSLSAGASDKSSDGTSNFTRPQRSSIADILSLDLTKTLNLNDTGGLNNYEPLPTSTSLAEFEREVLCFDMKQEENSVFEDSGISTDGTYSTMQATTEGGSGPASESGKVDETQSRLSSTSVSSSSSSGSGTEPYSQPPESVSSTNGKVASASSIRPHSVPISKKEGMPSSDQPPANFSVTGAIPKSISFDKSADKLFRDLEGDDRLSEKQRKGFFKLTNFRFTFKGRNRKSRLGERHSVISRTGTDSFVGELTKERSPFRQLHRTFSEDITSTNIESSDDILAKYRKKPSLITSDLSVVVVEGTPLVNSLTFPDGCLLPTEDDAQVFEPSNNESSFAFNDAKRKLRMVLGSADIQTLPWLNTSQQQNRLQPTVTNGLRLHDNELVAFLKVLLAEAINLQQRPLVAHLHEALRCIKMFDEAGCQKLLKSLQTDYKQRAPYISYLVRCRQGLLSTLAHLETLLGRIHRDKEVCSKYLITLCVRMFLEAKEKNIELFVRKFEDLTVADEMAQLVEKFLLYLYKGMDSDPVWQSASQAQLERAQTVIERTIMSQIYIRALYPNGDGDALRDQVLHQHMQKLSQVITLNHKDLRIPTIYQHECPWPSAQAEIITINAYKTPRDKIQCVLRCCSIIMNLLSMANDKSVPAADDFMPVLVFVLIKANPPSLLSTIQYVNTYEKILEGEDAYWWTQFSSAVEFIKTMDYQEQ